MNYDDLLKLLNYIQENNSWENMYDCHNRDRYCYKYVRVSVDTREHLDSVASEHVWHIILENGEMIKAFRDATFEEIKAFLDLPMKEASKQLEKKTEK